MDRKALVLYLRNVRDLEVARRIVGVSYNNEKNAYDRAIEQKREGTNAIHKTPEFKYERPGGCFILCLAVVILGVATIALGKYGIAIGDIKEEQMEWVWPVVLLDILIFGIGAMVLFPGRKKTQKDKYDREIAQIKKDNLNASNNNRAISQSINSLKSEWSRKDEIYKKEYNKLTSLLQSFYNMNIIPIQYRKLSAACYLYDFMSTSQESFQMALISNQIEEGIRRIEAKLDVITDLIREELYQTRLMREENRRQVQQTIDQNNRMLKQLQSIESNTYEAAQYAELSANYNKANAYFSLARYLDKK